VFGRFWYSKYWEDAYLDAGFEFLGRAARQWS